MLTSFVRLELRFLARERNKMAKVVSYFTRNTTNLINFSRPKLATAWRYARVELRPPTLREFPEIGSEFRNLMVSIRNPGKLTVKEAWLNTLVGAEILFWFFAGECIGKRNIVGYYIDGAVNWDIHF